jgi:hypothetical protein
MSTSIGVRVHYLALENSSVVPFNGLVHAESNLLKESLESA